MRLKWTPAHEAVKPFLIIFLGLSALVAGLSINSYFTRHYSGEITLPAIEAADLVHQYGDEGFTLMQPDSNGNIFVIYDFATKDFIGDLEYTQGRPHFDISIAIIFIIFGQALIIAFIWGIPHREEIEG